MKMKIMNKVLIVFGLFVASIVNASAEQIVGSWGGKLAVAPDSELVLHFDVEKLAKGYAVKVSSPDNTAIKNLAANNVTYVANKLSFELKDLSGRFEGKLSSGAIDGTWSQLNQKFPLRLVSLDQFVVAKTSKLSEVGKSLLGAWYGVGKLEKTTFNSLIYFRMDDAGELYVITEFPDNGPNYVPIKSMSLKGKDVRMDLWDEDQYFQGRVDGDTLKGMWSFQKLPFVIELKKKDWDPDYVSFKLNDKDKQHLLGTWYADMPAINEGVTLKMEFIETENGKIRGYLNSIDDGYIGVRMSTLAIDKHTKIAFTHVGQWTGKIDFDGLIKGNTISGKYVSNELNTNIEFTKGPIPAVVLPFPEKINKALVGSWAGNVDGQAFRLRFEQLASGIEGYIDTHGVGRSAVRVRFASYKDNKISLKTADTATEYAAKLVGNSLVGVLKVGDKEFKLKMTKSK